MLNQGLEAFFYLTNQVDGLFAHILDSFHLKPGHYVFFAPPGFEADQLNEMYDNGQYPKLSGLAPAITYAILFSIARFFIQHYLIKPFAKWCMQIKEVPFQADKDIDYNLPFNSPQSHQESAIRAYSKISGRDFDSVCHYLKDRRHSKAYDKKMVKFVEAFWRFVFYSVFVYLGYRALFVPETLPYVYETSSMWINWPKYNIPANILFYYLIELGCYIHQLCWTEVNRSDATEMIAHHIITITLILLSYLLCYWEIGSIFLLIHDVADIFLEGAKVLNYSSKPPHRRWIKKYFVDQLFGVFAVTFFVSRLIIYPRYVLYAVIAEGYEIYQCSVNFCRGLWAFPILLLLLQGLHIFWFYLICRMIYKLTYMTVEDDVRSEDEDEVVQYEGMDNTQHGQAKKDN